MKSDKGPICPHCGHQHLAQHSYQYTDDYVGDYCHDCKMSFEVKVEITKTTWECS